MKPLVTSSLPFSALLNNLIEHLEKKQFHPISIQMYRKCGKEISRILSSLEEACIDSNVYELLVSSITQNQDYLKLSALQKSTLRCLNAVIEYAAQGEITFRSYRKQKNYHGDLGISIRTYLETRKSIGMADKTIETKRNYLTRFQQYLEERDILLPCNISSSILIDYCLTLKRYSLPTAHCMLAALRGYLKYLHKIGIQSSDLSSIVPKDNYKKQARIPTTYSATEIQKLLSCVDRASPKGKRDYAMILLAALLGIRASDVCSLQFNNLNWERNVITFRQRKTETPIELPLLAEVGNALIDYLRYGRPESDSPYLFLHASGRYEALNKETFHSIVSHYLKISGIDTTNRKHGPHALRHSLASRLLDAKIPLPVISETLGHQTSDTTMLYLRIDITHLKQCALEVPVLTSNFYREG